MLVSLPESQQERGVVYQPSLMQLNLVDVVVGLNLRVLQALVPYLYFRDLDLEALVPYLYFRDLDLEALVPYLYFRESVK